MLEKQAKVSGVKLAKDAVHRAAKAIKTGKLSASNTAELIPVVKVLEEVNLESDRTTQNDLASVKKYLSKVSEMPLTKTTLTIFLTNNN
tara:strand:+ start:208 stop:474 length:267 start_codon:yes stop_codon:yes gene_type:complete